MKKWACQLEGVAVQWPSRKEPTLMDIHLPPSLIEENAMLPLMGPSGQGKSTLLYLLAALKWPSQGKITWTFPDNKSCSWDKKGPTSNEAVWLRRERFGFAFQDNTLSAHLTVLENIAYPLVLQGKRWAEALAQAKKQLQEVLLPDENMDDVTASFPKKLSGGQQQRVALAQAMIHKPWVLFADEPTGQLDYHTRLQVMAVLKKWVKKGSGKHRLIWVTHHHTDDLNMMNIDKLLFVNNSTYELWDCSQLEDWKNKAKKRYLDTQPEKTHPESF
ncbi:MAG: hypothetical protein DRR19_06870 [Candidatus Parabeggiatoa sp. nov. 1]|nr:MAG: hypothetical protein DRR19_06870 [Gammaproteobacteria bacterium]